MALLPLLFLVLAQVLPAAPRYLPQDLDYDPAITTPADFLGYEIGERHLTHAELVGYLRQLDRDSERIEIIDYGRTHGHRPLLQLLISSPENLARKDEIRQRQRGMMDPARSQRLDVSQMPIVVNLNYGVHGNEPSASNSAPVVAYFLAAARDDSVQEILQNTVILLDPSLNPDGFDRFAHWANNNVGKNPNPDPNTREHREDWPSGRTNYYWFDLNRDWMLLTQPESRGRLALYRQWMPNFVLDFHEMQTDRTFFFQPGVPERNNPLTPQSVYDLTDAVSQYFARAFDAEGRLYYTRETFDDFYMGKGSSMTDLNGAVGILFEQASSRGHVQDSNHGEVTFPFTIQNQVTAAFASLRAAVDLREEFHNHMRTFYREAMEEAHASRLAGYRFASPEDPARAAEFADVLHQHEIVAQRIADEEGAWFIPAEQPHYRYLQALIEQRRDFDENIFYDITAWTLPLAYNLEWNDLRAAPRTAAPEPRELMLPTSRLGYVLDWVELNAPRVLLDLLQEDVLVKVARRPFTLEGRSFGYGAILIPLQPQPDKAALIHKVLLAGVQQQGADVVPVTTFLTEEGIDLGSPSFELVETPRIVLAAGNDVNPSEAGYIWHLLDVLHDYPVTLVSPDRLKEFDLAGYTALILPPTSESVIEELDLEELKAWTHGGGTVVALGASARWAIENEMVGLGIVGAKDAEDAEADGESIDEEPVGQLNRARRPFAHASDDAAIQQIRGAIFQTYIDTSHPVAYGYTRDTLPVFHAGETFLAPSGNRYQTPLLFTEQPLLAGYTSPENLEEMAGSAAIVVEQQGKGAVILFNISPTFRAYWRGTEKLLLNAILFGPLMDAKDPE